MRTVRAPSAEVNRQRLGATRARPIHARMFVGSMSERRPGPSVAATGEARVRATARRDVPTFQDAILRLQEYWSARGCAIVLPHNTEVGAGTMNPRRRCLGPEPWSVCYPEPSVRPDDSRYGENPNRVQKHTQFQVILKPAPENVQEMYLGSLERWASTQGDDVRFVRQLESPVLGSWGLGWEVWMDGMEVTQFTYFQQCGSLKVAPTAVEIACGLERILMALQGVDHFKDIAYNDRMTYGEMRMQEEYEMSVFNLDEASVETHRERFNMADEEAIRMLVTSSVAACDNLLKASHAFNVLDARGAVGVTERQKLFASMRKLAQETAQLWVARREELGYPLGSPALGAARRIGRATYRPRPRTVSSRSAPKNYLRKTYEHVSSILRRRRRSSQGEGWPRGHLCRGGASRPATVNALRGSTQRRGASSRSTALTGVRRGWRDAR